MIILWTWY